jgi:hypothetical protein
MSSETILTIVLGLFVLIFISVRQMRWQQADIGKLMKMPLILALAGVVIAATSWTGNLLSHVGPLDFLVAGVELGAALVGGWLMGRLTEIATIKGVTQSRLRPAGLAVWLGFIALRVGLGVIAGLLGAALASTPAMILFMIAIVKATQGLIVRDRIARHELSASNYRTDTLIGS